MRWRHPRLLSRRFWIRKQRNRGFPTKAVAFFSSHLTPECCRICRTSEVLESHTIGPGGSGGLYVLGKMRVEASNRLTHISGKGQLDLQLPAQRGGEANLREVLTPYTR
jgi:hypothetical protein